MTVSEKTIEDAWKRFGNSEDGQIARKMLVQVFFNAPSPSVESGAATAFLGECNLARKLLNLMDAHITDAERSDDTDSRPARRRPRDFSGKRR